MKTLFKPVIGAAIVLAMAAQPALAKKKDEEKKEQQPAAAAPAAGGVAVQGIAIANLDAALVNSNAFRVAAQQRQTTYKANYDQAQARGKALEAQLKPMVDKFNAERGGPKPVAASLQAQAQAINAFQERGKQEIQQILLPVALSEAYVTEQIEEKMNEATQKAMEKNHVTLLLQPQAVLARANSYELTDEIIAELNILVPAANLVPPQGWEPREIREARAAQQGAKPAVPAPATAAPARPAGPQPEGR